MKEPKFKIIFSSHLKPLVSEEKDKYLAMATLAELGKFLPDIDTSKNYDLLPVAFNACVINRVNKNDDAIDTPTALAIYKEFINKPINVEHNRQKVIGVILTAGFSEFGSDKPLTEAQVKELKGPFNIVLGGVIWKTVNPKISELIEDASDPTSENYLKVSASWELGFHEYNIIVLNGSDRNIENGKLISNEEEVDKLSPFLRSNGGNGKDAKDNKLCRMPKNTSESFVVPMGIGLTENPAAEVKGVATDKHKESEAQIKEEEVQKEMKILQDLYQQLREGKITKEQFKEKSGADVLDAEVKLHTNASSAEHYIENCSCGTRIGQCRCDSPNKKIVVTENGCAKCKEKKNNFSQSTNQHVNIERKQIMKFKTLQDLTDDNLKQSNASEVATFIQEQLSQKSVEWEKEKSKSATDLQKAQDDAKKANDDLVKVNKTVESLQASVQQLEKEKKDREAVEKFNTRMTEITKAYDLDEAAQTAITEDIKVIASDEDFAKWLKKASVLLKGFAKKTETAEEKTAKEVEAKKQRAEAALAEFNKKYSEAKSKEDKAKVLEEAMASADIDKTKLPNSSSAASPSLKEKYASAFAADGFTIKL